MAHYTIDEFLNDTADDTNINTVVDKKVSLLYDFCVLRHRGTSADSREAAVRAYLKRYCTEAQLTRVLHDVLVGNKTVDQLLKGAYTNV